MKRSTVFVFFFFLTVGLIAGCKSARKPPMIDPDQTASTIVGDGVLNPEDDGSGTLQPGDVRPMVEGDLNDSGSGGRLTALEPIFFDYDRSDIRPDQILVLEKNAGWLSQKRNATVLIEGHCDERGTEEYNLALGARRAEMTRNYLIGLGVESGRVRTVTYGESRPFAAAHDEEAWQKNRRAHFVSNSPN